MRIASEDKNAQRLNAAAERKWYPDTLEEWARIVPSHVCSFNYNGGSMGTVTGYVIRTGTVDRRGGYLFAVILLGEVSYCTLEELCRLELGTVFTAV